MSLILVPLAALHRSLTSC